MENLTIKEKRPKKYIRPMPIFWWVHRWVHIKFIARELTSVFVAAYAVIFLLYVRSIGRGPDAFADFSERLRVPALIVFHAVALLVLLFHSITWFNLAPQAMVIKIGDRKVPGVVIALLNYAGWVVISAVLAWIMLHKQ